MPRSTPPTRNDLPPAIGNSSREARSGGPLRLRDGAGMTPEDWTRLKGILQEALEREPTARDRYLHEICGGDGTLLAQARSLLDADATPWPLLDQEGGAAPPLEPDGPRIGERLGAWELVE